MLLFARCLRCMVGFGVGDGGLMPTFIYVKPLDCHIDLDIISICFVCSMTFHYGINLPLLLIRLNVLREVKKFNKNVFYIYIKLLSIITKLYMYIFLGYIIAK